MSDLEELLQEFKTIRESNAKTLSGQEQFRKVLQQQTEQYSVLERKLSGVVKELNQTIGTIPKSVKVVNRFGIEPKSWYYIGGFVLALVFTIWFTPSAKQSLREWEMEQDFKSMKAHLDYHIANNPKTERHWQGKP